MDPTQRLVLVVDDDESVRRSLRWSLLPWATPSRHPPRLRHAGASTDQPAILLIDVRMPDMTGLEVKQKLVGDGPRHGDRLHHRDDDVAIGVEAMKSGAEDFLLKPFEETEALDAAQRAISRHAPTRRSVSSWPTSAGATRRSCDENTRSASASSREDYKQIAVDRYVRETVKVH